jgi:hypothetical protein
MRLGTALQIGFLKMCGRPLDRLQRVPVAVLEYLSSQVGGTAPDIATLRAIYVNRPRTLYQHQQFALDMLGITKFEITADAPRVLRTLIDLVRAGIDGDKLLAEIRVVLYEHRYVIPRPRTVGELAKRARKTVEHEIGRAIEKMISPEIRAQWVEKLFSVRADGMTVLEFLQEPPGTLRTRSIVRESEKVRTLREMTIPDLTALTGTERYWQMYAMRMRHQRRSRFAQRNEPRRSIELVGFLRHSLAEHSDTLVRMVDRRVSTLWGQASKQAKADQGALPALTVLLAELRQAIAGTAKIKTKAQRFDVIVKLVERYDAGELQPQSIAARQRALLVKEIRQIRPLLKSLVGLDLHADDASHWPALIVAWKEAYDKDTDQLTTAMAPPKSKAWKSLAEAKPEANKRNAAEAQILWELRQALRRRSVHVPSSLSFQSRAAVLDPGGSTVTAARADYPVKTMLQELVAEIEDGLERVSEAVKRGELTLDGAKVKVKRLTAQRAPLDLKDARRELYRGYCVASATSGQNASGKMRDFELLRRVCRRSGVYEQRRTSAIYG